MAFLNAQGGKQTERWRRPLNPGERVVIGRAPGTWQMLWEPFLSGRHVELVLQNGVLRGKTLPGACNPVFCNGRAVEKFQLRPGDHFVIGDTVITLTEEEIPTAENAPEPVQMHAFQADELQRTRFNDAGHKLDVLTRLPNVISGATSDTELFVRLVDMLLTGIARADVVALVEVSLERPTEAAPTVLHWDRRRHSDGSFRPSRRLILEALCRRGQSVLQAWVSELPQSSEFTQQGDYDWAFCTPVYGDAARSWGVYVAGRLHTDAGLNTSLGESGEMQAEVKFTELVAAIVRSLRQVQRLEQRQASLGHFFSPAVMAALAGNDPEIALRPQETIVTVLFCDLRGFSRASEQHADDLLALLNRVSRALGVMTENIFSQGGVIADFQGDAAMGFWGWPIGQADAVRRACIAALCIRTVFEAACNRPGHALAGFQVGIGIATGPGVAGKMGVRGQAKIGVFGPVVNLASRLEGMTKILGAAILMDEETARIARAQMPKTAARCRKLAYVTPVGLDTPVMVNELLPPVAEFPVLTDEHIRHYEAGLQDFIAGKWPQALEHLQHVPMEDCAKDFLIEFILRHKRVPPPNWKGQIPLLQKE